MTIAAIFPTKYVQGSRELKNIKKYVEHLGNSFFVLISESGYKRFGSLLKESFGDSVKVDFAIFNGECSKTEINRLREEFKAKGSDVIIAVGGGKIHDTCKAIGYYEKAPVVIVPTIASTDAPCSAVAVIYTDDGVVEEYLFVPKNPDLVLVDTEIVANAPARLLVAGMGDALATYFEARAAVRSHSKTMAGAYTSVTGFALAKLCYDTLIAEGYKAKLAVENKVVTQALEKIVEANTLLSGIGFESGGLGAAHSVHNGFTALEETHSLYHGEKVAFGVLTQLVLENAPMEEIEEVLYFCNQVGLPTTLRELNVTDKSKEKLMKVAELSCAEGETIHCMPFEVTPEDVYAAILTADAMGENYKKNK